jgi:hypothetical protein
MERMAKQGRDRDYVPREVLKEFQEHNARMQRENSLLRQEILKLQAQIAWLESKPHTLAYPVLY